MQERLEPEIAELLARKVAGEAVEEDTLLKTWLAQSGNAARAELLAEASKVHYTQRPSSNSREFADKVLRQLTAQKSEGYSNKTLRRWVGYGAVLATAIIIVAVSIIPTVTQTNQDETETRTYTTIRGQRAKFTVGSTTVTLGPSSKLVTKTTNNGAFEATLDGEALFATKHSASVPFTIRANNTLTAVLGTTFAVRGYASDTAVRVVVAEGKVQLRAPTSGKAAVLTAGDAAQVNTKGQLSTLSEVSLASALGWAEGKLVFDGTPLRDVLIELGRSYDFDFYVRGSMLGAREITASLTVGNLEGNLLELGTLLDARYVRNGRTITFVPNGQRD